VVLSGQNLTARKPTAGAVRIAHDLGAGAWQVTGSMTSLAVTHAAQTSTLRASGSITTISLGASYGSTFLAGVTSQQLDPTVTTAADLNALSTIGSLSVKGWAVPRGQPVLAPGIGTLSVLNLATPTSWQLFVREGPSAARITRVTVKDNRFPKDTTLNWTWTPAKGGLPGGATVTTLIPD
jgi:hypothetical protein